jgi:polyisoprenyl-phosphate glycosyltransferase
MQRFEVVVPAFNEAGSLPSLVAALQQVRVGDAFRLERIIVVDDGSSDETWSVLQRLHEQGAAVSGVRLSRNFGKEAAIEAGLRASGSALVVVMDADHQHPPGLIAELLERRQASGCAVVSAIKSERQAESWPRRRLAALFYWAFSRATGFDVRRSSDFKLLTREVVDAYLALPERDKFFRGLTRWLGYDESVVEFAPPALGDESGASRWSMLALARYALRSLSSFSSVPLSIVTWLGFLTLVASIALGSLAVVRWAAGQAVEGFTTVILAVLFVGSVLMISLGIIGHYLARIYDELKRRPAYVIRDRLPAAAPRG